MKCLGLPCLAAACLTRPAISSAVGSLVKTWPASGILENTSSTTANLNLNRFKNPGISVMSIIQAWLGCLAIMLGPGFDEVGLGLRGHFLQRRMVSLLILMPSRARA